MITGRLKQTSSSYAARLQFTWVLLVAGIASSLSSFAQNTLCSRKNNLPM